MDLFSWGQLLTLMIMAIAISMDAFSLGVGVGTIGIRHRHMLKLSFVIGLAHLLMPLVGILSAQVLSRYVGIFATYIGGGLLIIMGLHMLWSAFSGVKLVRFVPIHGIALFVFAFSVSIDALSVGFSLGLFSANTWLTVILCGFWGMTLTMLGLLIGKHVGYWLGRYGETLGGLVLCILGLKFIL